MLAQEILAIPLSEPERLFPNSLPDAKNKRNELFEAWHPDKNQAPEASKVFNHVKELYASGVVKITAGTWSLPHMLILKGTDGKTREITFKVKRPFELGQMYYGKTVLCYVVDAAYIDLFHAAINNIKSFQYASDNMKQEMSKYLPQIISSFVLKDGRGVLVLSKTPDVFALRDVVDYCKGSLDQKHVAWVLNSFYNILCYLRFAGLTHNAVCINNCFISPKTHSGLLLGGWWYSALMGDRLKAVPKMAAPYIASHKGALYKTDLTLIRLMGKELLGGQFRSAHKDIISYLNSPPGPDAVEDYRYWSKVVLNNAFGKRRFVELVVPPDAIYKG